MLPFVMLKFCWTNSYILEDLLFLSLCLFFLFFLDMLYLLRKDFHLFETQVDLLGQLVAQIFVYWSLFIVEHRFEWLTVFIRKVIFGNFLSNFRLPLSPILLGCRSCRWFLINIRDSNPTQFRFIFEDALADILMTSVFV